MKNNIKSLNKLKPRKLTKLIIIYYIIIRSIWNSNMTYWLQKNNRRREKNIHVQQKQKQDTQVKFVVPEKPVQSESSSFYFPSAFHQLFPSTVPAESRWPSCDWLTGCSGAQRVNYPQRFIVWIQTVYHYDKSQRRLWILLLLSLLSSITADCWMVN